MTEYFDILTKDGTPTGASLSRDEVHAKGLWHGSVHAWVMNSRGQLLLQQRARTKRSHPGLWDVTVCGHISAGDDPVTTAVREFQEELGLTVDPAQFEQFFVLTHEHDVSNAQGPYVERLITPNYLVRTDVDETQLTLAPDEVAAVRWMNVPEIEQALATMAADYALEPEESTELFALLQREVTTEVK